MKEFKREEILNYADYLTLLSKEYNCLEKIRGKIITLKSALNLPKGTEHFITDIHGENEAFEHVLRNCSGSIKRKVEEILGDKLSEEDLKNLTTLIYYPKEKLALLKEELNINYDDEWYKGTITNLLEVLKIVSSKYTRKKVRNTFNENYAQIIEELLHKDETIKRKLYYDTIIDTIIDTMSSCDFIIELCNGIRKLNLDHLHIVGDIYDRGRGPHKVMDILLEYNNIDIQWGNHDILWMGASLGDEACIANVVRICLRYGNISVLKEGYGVDLLDLALFAEKVYKDEDEKSLEKFVPKLNDEIPDIDEIMLAKMHKAISINQFKLESGIIKSHEEYDMDSLNRMDSCDFEKNIVKIQNKEYKLNTANFPTLDKNNPSMLSEEEKKIIKGLKRSFMGSRELFRHMEFLRKKGSMYITYNDNLLFHACIPLNEDGSFKAITIDNNSLIGKELFDFINLKVNYISSNENQDTSFFWYLWCSPNSPLFGKTKMATFERYFLEEESIKKEEYLPYYKKVKEYNTCTKILKEFSLIKKVLK